MTRAGSAWRPESVRRSSLRRSSDFDRVFREGSRRREGPLVIVTAPGLPGEIRFGVVAGRRIGPAVVRNRVKRRLRHAVREVPLDPGTDVVVVGSRGALTADFEDLVRWIARGCAQEQGDG